MEELITVFDYDGRQAVSARELHLFLENGKQFADWIKGRIEKYELIEGQDYVTFSPISEKGRPTVEYVLSIDAAKELSMVEANDRGKKARRYFIEVEKRAKSLIATTPNSATSVSRRELAMMVLEAETEIERLNKEVEERGKVIVSQAKKVAYVDEVLTAKNCWTTTTIAKDLGMSAIALNKILKDLGIQFERDNHWVLKAPYDSKGYTQSNTYTYNSTAGQTRTSISTVWTELGRAFIVKKVTEYRSRQLPSA